MKKAALYVRVSTSHQIDKDSLPFQRKELENYSKYILGIANTVKYIYNLYEQTASTTKVAHQLNSEQVKTKRNGKWTAKTINDILRNPFYIGTYRYNVKTSTTRRWKNEKEWIVIENNHPGFIEPSQFEKVNSMLSANYKGNGEFQRENTNTHIFSKILFCGKCDSNLSAGLDRARSDGYRPSRYTCYSVKFQDSAHHCNNFISDVTLLPFILNYIANFAKLQNKITVNHSLRDIEKSLLRGHAFVDVAAIDKPGLESTYLAFAKGFDDDSYQSSESEAAATNLELENLKKEKIKFEKALTRLEELFLFSEEAMSQKDFLFKKRDLTQNLDRINESLNNLHKTQLNKSLVTDIAFLNKSSNFLMSQHLLNKRSIDYRELLDLVDKELIKDFIQTAISKIVVVDKKVYSITFQNGITHNFAYKPQEQQKVRPKTTFLYRSYEPTILEYLKEHDSITRPLLEELTGLTRASAGAVLKDLVDKNVIEKKGHSTATQYSLIPHPVIIQKE